MELRSPLFLAGPTASGKSALALELARRLGGEVISVDSMQVYRGMDVGTAKPCSAERALVRHHLIDIVEITDCFDAAQFVTQARAAVAEISAHSQLPILCGGTGLYFAAFLGGLGQAPGSDPALRAELEAAPTLRLLRELELRDPDTFARIDQQNRRRLVRAVEVLRLTGKPFSAQRAPWERSKEGAGPGTPPQGPFIVLDRLSDDLAARIEQRVDKMFSDGLVAETKMLLDNGLARNQTARQALGYRQVLEHLEGKRSLPETISLVKQKTRQFAKRQRTWFRGQTTARWLQVNPGEVVAQLADRVQQLYEAQPR